VIRRSPRGRTSCDLAGESINGIDIGVHWYAWLRIFESVVRYVETGGLRSTNAEGPETIDYVKSTSDRRRTSI
jgi:hypothetical protein